MADGESKPKKRPIWLRSDFWYLVFYYVSVALAWIIGFNLIMQMFIDYKTDTTSLSNGAFAIVASTAALCFSCARAVSAESNVANQFVFAGQKLFFAALILILASLAKYALLNFQLVTWIAGQPVLLSTMNIVFGMSAATLFGIALRFTSTSVESILELLEKQVTNIPDLKQQFKIRR
jgi:hypothetical protein